MARFSRCARQGAETFSGQIRTTGDSGATPRCGGVHGLIPVVSCRGCRDRSGRLRRRRIDLQTTQCLPDGRGVDRWPHHGSGLVFVVADHSQNHHADHQQRHDARQENRPAGIPIQPARRLQPLDLIEHAIDEGVVGGSLHEDVFSEAFPPRRDQPGGRWRTPELADAVAEGRSNAVASSRKRGSSATSSPIRRRPRKR